MFPTRHVWTVAAALVALLSFSTGQAADLTTPEGVLRALVQANVDKDFATISKFMAHDEDIISYTIEGRKYVGWNDFAKEMHNEFASVTRLEIPITQLKVWTRGDTAWFVMERRKGQWMLVSFHESFRDEAPVMPGSGNQAFPSLK